MKNSLLEKFGLFSWFAAAVLCLTTVCAAQEQTAADEDEDIPPPVVALSSAESAQLNSAVDFKARTQLCLQLADERLARAETLTNNADFEQALSELGGYQAVIENGLKFLRDRNNDSRKLRDNFKRLELGLRAHAPRIETIRRSTPFNFGKYVKAVLNYARDARTRALDAFFSDTVMKVNLDEAATEAGNGATKQTQNQKP